MRWQTLMYILFGGPLMACGGVVIGRGLSPQSNWSVMAFALGVLLLAQVPLAMLRRRIEALEKKAGQ